MGTLGQHLVDELLPEKFRNRGPLTKSNLHGVLSEMAKEDPSKYAITVTNLKRLGDEFATLEGISVGLDDIATEKRRHDLLNPYIERYNQAKGLEKENVLYEAQNAALEYTKTHPGVMSEMARSGGRGSAGALMKIVAAPVLALDEHDKVVPWFIKHNYAEGLKPAESWITGNEARINSIKSSLSPADSGDFAKIIVNNMNDKLVTMPDCGTMNGIPLAAGDPSVIDRYLAAQHGIFPAGTLVTPAIARSLNKSDSIIVRSPMTCQAPHGVCQKCQGLDANGKNHTLGTNVGMRAAQALAEPLTQSALSSKHGSKISAGAATEMVPEGIKGIRQMLELPQSFLHRAILAEHDGTVARIEEAPQGGHYVWVDDTRLYVEPDLSIAVKPGQKVEAGDRLSNGIPRPDDVVRLKGLGQGRQYLVDTLHKVYGAIGGVDRRHLETLAHSVMNYVQITDPGEDSNHGFVKGDIVNYNNFLASLAQSRKHLPLDEAVGETLGGNVLHFTAGTRITPSMSTTLKSHGITSVDVATTGPRAEPVLRAASRMPLLNPDWMARLAHRYLKESIVSGAHRGDVSDTHGANPVPAYAAGATFGEGVDWRY